MQNLQTFIRMSVGLSATEIYANWVRKEEWDRWVMMFVREARTLACSKLTSISHNLIEN